MTETISFLGNELDVQYDRPIPAITRKRHDLDSLASLPVGGSVDVECAADERQKMRNRIRRIERRTGVRFELRSLDGAVGVWRVG